LGEVGIASVSQSLLDGDTAWIPNWFRSISIVVGLNDEPIVRTEFVVGMNTFDFSFYYDAFSYTGYDVVDRSTYFDFL
jgi:hypothetical protein